MSFICTLCVLIFSLPIRVYAQCGGASFANYADFTIATVKVNFHFLPVRPTRGANYTQAEADTVAQQLVYFANANLASMVPSNLSPDPSGISDSKIRFELYDGGQGSVFTYSDTFDPSNSTGYTPRYGQQVLNVVVGYYDNCQNTGVPGGNVITMCDFDRDITTNQSQQANRALVLCHEVGHTFDLFHSFDCTPQCSNDINHNIECAGTCGCTTPSNPSNNMMSYGGGNNALTPCQWETMFNYILDSNLPFVTWNDGNCGNINDNLIITSASEIWNTPKFLKKNIVIESGASLTIKCLVRMGTDNIITVKRGARLIVDGGRIANLCEGNTWGGIYVWGNSSLNQPDPFSVPSSNEAGILFLKNNAIIEGTRTAVSSARRDDGSLSWYDLIQYRGGVIYANNATFRNISRAVEFISYHCSGGNCIDDDKSTFIDCVFDNSTANLSDAQCITIWDTNGISFEGCSFSGFQDAILTYDAGIDVRRSTQFGINPSFQNNEYALNFEATYPNSFGSTIRNAAFYNNLYGIYSNASNSVRRHNFSLNTFSSVYENIHMMGTSRFTIAKNTITSSPSGIYLWNTGSSDNKIICNTISGIQQAGIYVSRSNTGLKFLGNTFSSNAYQDIEIRSSPFATTVAPAQGDNGIAAGNTFSSNNNSIVAIDHRNLYSRPGVNFTYYLPNTVTATTNSNLVPQCNLTAPAVLNCFTLNKFNVSVNTNDQVTSCVGVENFGGDDDDGGEEYVFYGLRTEVDNLSRATANGRNRQLYPELTEKSARKNNMLNGLLKKALTSKDIQLAKRLLKEEQDDGNKKKLVGVCFDLKEWQEAKVFLNDLPNQVEAWRDFKSVQLINLDRLKSKERFKLTPHQRQTLLDIIDRDDTDNAAYARAILQLLEGMRFRPNSEVGFNADNAALAMKTTPSKPVSESITITPNPAIDQVNFTVPAAHKIQRIDIYGIDGQLYRTITVENEKITTDTANMLGGMYIVKFIDEQGISKQITKLFINK